MNPPLRSRRDRDALRRALADGTISVIASDHAPHSPAEKAVPYEQAPSGVIGLETTLGVIWTDLVGQGLLGEVAAVRAMTDAPAAVLRIAPPALRVGAPADVTLIDPQHGVDGRNPIASTRSVGTARSPAGGFAGRRWRRLSVGER